MHGVTKFALSAGCVIAAVSGVDAATHQRDGDRAGRQGVPRRLCAGPQPEDQDHRQRAVRQCRTTFASKTLPAGDYRLQMRAIGFKADPKNGIALTADQNLPQDLALQQGMVRWSDISMHQGKKLLPEGARQGGVVRSLHGLPRL